jgi:hypothetical protein
MLTIRRRPTLPALLTLLTLACSGRESRSHIDSAAGTVANVVDSVVSRDVALQRFRAATGSRPVVGLRGGAASLQALAQRFGTALEAKDTAALRAMALDQAEFAYIYYPSSPLGLPPYDLSPQLMWFQMTGNSGRGLTHVLAERGGQPLRIAGITCDAPETQGENRVYGHCMVARLQSAGDIVKESLFGGVIERGGTFKILSYTNKL